MANKNTPITQIVNSVVRKKVKVAKPINPYLIEQADEDGISIEDKNGSVFSADISNLNYCCGVYEIGDILIEYSTLRQDKNFNDILDNCLNLLVNKVTDSSNRPKCKTLIANLINNEACNTLRDSFIRTGLFTLVKTFTNKGSNNQIEIWISNN